MSTRYTCGAANFHIVVNKGIVAQHKGIVAQHGVFSTPLTGDDWLEEGDYHLWHIVEAIRRGYNTQTVVRRGKQIAEAQTSHCYGRGTLVEHYVRPPSMGREGTPYSARARASRSPQAPGSRNSPRMAPLGCPSSTTTYFSGATVGPHAGA